MSGLMIIKKAKSFYVEMKIADKYTLGGLAAILRHCLVTWNI